MGASREHAAERAVLLFKIVEDLGVGCGYERSFKMQEQTLLANRFLLGISTSDVTQEQLLEICRRLDMPRAYLESFQCRLPDANLAFLGFEDNQPGCVYKVYLEFWEKAKKEIRAASDRKRPALLHLGFKWRTDDNSQGTTAQYLYYPMLSVQALYGRLADVYSVSKDSISLGIAKDIVSLAGTRSDGRSFIYLEVSEEHNPRRSFDINLYRAEIRLSEVFAMLSRLCEDYSIPAERFERLFRTVGDKTLGHLSGGIDRAGKEFLTVYYEV